MIIGLTGRMGAGKGEVAKILKDMNFEHYTYSDIIKEEAKKRNIELTRNNLQELGTKLKEEKGHGYLSKLMLHKIKSDKAVVDGIRNPAEVKELRQAKGFILIAVDAPKKLRFKRLKKRGRKGDPETFEEFKKLDKKENQGETIGQKINETMKMADYLLMNTDSKKDLEKKVKFLINHLTE